MVYLQFVDTLTFICGVRLRNYLRVAVCLVVIFKVLQEVITKLVVDLKNRIGLAVS